MVETGRPLWGKGREGWEKGLAAGCLAGWKKKTPLEEGDWRVTGEGREGVEGPQRPLWENQRQRQ